MSSAAPVSTAKGFDGIFDGNGKTISNLSITRFVPNTGAYGLFGYVNGGVINDLTVTGAVTSYNSNESVGGIVGYIKGDIYNCKNQATVTVQNGVGSRIGGVAGTVMDGYVQYCANTGAVTGYSSLGGVVGALNCTTDGGSLLSQSYNTGTVTTINANAGRRFVGGVVGYCMGDLEYSYNNGDIVNNETNTTSLTRCFEGGVAGILYGYGNSISASMTGCYNSGSFSYASGITKSNLASVQELYGSSDGSANVVVSCSYWPFDSTIGQDNGTNVSDTAATWTSGTVSGTTLSSIVGNGLSATYYTTGTTPTLNCQALTAGSVGAIYYNNNAASNGTGTAGSPYNSITDALTHVSDHRYSIYPMSGAETVNSALTINSIAVFHGTGSSMTLFSVASGGTLTLDGGVTLTGCGTAVDVAAGGSLTVYDASITGTSYSVKLTDSSSYFLLQNTGSTGLNGTVYLGSGAYITAGAAISSSVVVQCASAGLNTVIVEVDGNDYEAFDADDLNNVSYYDTTLFGVDILDNVDIVLVSAS